VNPLTLSSGMDEEWLVGVCAPKAHTIRAPAAQAHGSDQKLSLKTATSCKFVFFFENVGLNAYERIK
jgi:hypothetical protein